MFIEEYRKGRGVKGRVVQGEQDGGVRGKGISQKLVAGSRCYGWRWT